MPFPGSKMQRDACGGTVQLPWGGVLHTISCLVLSLEWWAGRLPGARILLTPRYIAAVRERTVRLSVHTGGRESHRPNGRPQNFSERRGRPQPTATPGARSPAPAPHSYHRRCLARCLARRLARHARHLARSLFDCSGTSRATFDLARHAGEVTLDAHLITPRTHRTRPPRETRPPKIGFSRDADLKQRHLARWPQEHWAPREVASGKWGTSRGGLREMGHLARWRQGNGAPRETATGNRATSRDGVTDLGHLARRGVQTMHLARPIP
eukprot:gene19043-biopygen23651